jgi:hypothetical protein
MFADETSVLIILPTALVNRARGLSGRATMSMKLSVSLQIVLRALIEETLKRPTDAGLLANIVHQAETVRRIRRQARRRPPPVHAIQRRAAHGPPRSKS